MRHVLVFVLMTLALLPGRLPAQTEADDRLVRLHVPQALVETGLTQHILPRFSLKTQVRVALVAEDGADMVFGSQGRALFEGAGGVWHMQVVNPDHPGTKRFADWLTSDIGQRTIFDFAPSGTALFNAPKKAAQQVAEVTFDGDAALGRDVSRLKCGRCHVTHDADRMHGIDSTPSFFVLRSLPDWEARFAAFYVLKPHGAFTQIDGVTDPFPDHLPSPIVPIALTLNEVEAMLAYVAGLQAADLGAPIKHQ